MPNKILVVEDEPSLAKILKFDLETVGFKVTVASDGLHAYELSKQEKFVCMIIDWMLPGLNGVELIKKLRVDKTSSLLIMLTAKTSEFDAIEALSGGADLYLKKPVSNRELIAQIKALIGLSKKDVVNESELITFADISLDPKQFKVFVKTKEIELTKMEFDLLRFFIANKEKALSRDTILNAIWGFEYDGTTRIVDVHIYNLKKKLDKAGCTFKPVRGVGYTLIIK
jgi:two-component system, OmpR family, alkaline phosphatase synthesis response regulator PhoP